VLFFLFLSYVKRFSLLPPPEDELGRAESGDRPIGSAANFLDEGIKMFTHVTKIALICVATT
jgi:hypothetical protein